MTIDWTSVVLALITMVSGLGLAGCASSRRATERLRVEGSELREVETRDSLREEISQNLNENLTEHEVVTWTVIQPQGDTVKVERVTDRTRETGSKFKAQSSKVEVRTEIIRDTVYVERRDTVEVQKFQGTKSLIPQPSSLNLIKWLFAIICAITVLIITLKVCLRRI